jgi:putative membrane protein
MYLNRAEADAIESRIAALEARTGTQVVTAVIGKADHYGELPWKAFALGAALAALAIVAFDWLHPDWFSAYTALAHVLAILGTGAADALLVIFIPAYARIFLNAAHAASEVRHYAQSLFLRRGLCDTSGRNGILLLVSLFERRIEIYADKGHDGNVGEPQWRSVIAVMMPHLAAGNTVQALQRGLQRLEEILPDRGPRPAREDKNELPDRPIEERGAK